ncbi:ubiquitin carboxyl-terminal hydrolase 37-like isoform X1, partial [Clarias magur]
VSNATNQSQQRSEESTEKKMDGTRSISKSLLWRNKVEHHAACTKSSETLEPEGDGISLNLIGGYSGTNKKASTTHNHNIAERKQVSVKAACELSGTKHTKVRESSVRTNFQGLMRISPVMVERNNTTLKDKVKKTTERRATNTNGFNVKPPKIKQIGANPILKFPRTKLVQVKETLVNTNLQNSAGTSVMRNKMQKRENTTSYSQEENSTAKRQTYTYGLNLKSAETKQVGARLHSGTKHIEVIESPVRRNVQNPIKIIPFIMEWKKTTLYVQEKMTGAWKQPMQSSEQNETEGLSKKRKKLAVSSYMRYRKSSTARKTFSSKRKMLEQSKRTTSLPHNLSLLTKMQLFNGGLPNVGNSCYVNASLQCLFTAEAFCEELSHLLDSSFQNNMNSFLRCFVNLLKLRKTSKVQGVIGKDCLLLVLIALAEDINPEFTIGKQSDAHEFLCHCLTQIEELGRGLGWKEDSEPKCPVRSNFKFMMRNIIKCSSCGYEQKNKVEEFKHISLPLEHNSVDQCLHDIVNKPTFVESKCGFCGGKSASSRLTFHTLPSALKSRTMAGQIKVVFVLLLAMAATAFGLHRCPAGWEDFQGRCFKYHGIKLDWASAEKHCLNLGANLISIHSEEEYLYAKSIIRAQNPGEDPTWIGLYTGQK